MGKIIFVVHWRDTCMHFRGRKNVGRSRRRQMEVSESNAYLLISSVYFLQVRKAAYQSLGPFISTFYVPNSETPSPENTSLNLLGDSVLLDNSLVESSALTTTGNSNTEDSSSENRHPVPNPPNQLISNSSTPIHSNGQGNDKGSTSTQRGTASDSQFSNFEFWRSPIPKVGGDGRVDKLAESLGNLSLEDIEDTQGNIPTDSQGSCVEEDESVKERCESDKDEVKSSIQGKLDFDDRTDCPQDMEGAQVGIHTEKKSEEQRQVEAQSEAESKVNEESDNKDVQDTQSSSSEHSNEPPLQMSTSAPSAHEHQSVPSSTTIVEVASTSHKAGTGSTPPGSSVSSVSSNGPPTEPPPRLSTREDSRRGADVAIAADDAMRIRSCSAGSSLRRELGSNLMFEEEKKGSGETKKRRWSLDKMNKLQENNALPAVSSCRCCICTYMYVCL
jgi:hypothetical protein